MVDTSNARTSFGGPAVNNPTRSSTGTYTIQVGDTPASIASRLGISLDALIKANPTIEHNGQRVPLTGNMSLSNGTLYYPTGSGGAARASTSSGDPLLDELQGLPGQERDAYAALKTLFESYGLGSLAPTILKYLQNGFGADTITILLQQTPEYKARFAGNEQRRQAGLQVLTPAEYLSTEASYKQLLRQNGIDPHFDTESQYAEWIGKDVSPNELQQRVNLAVQAGSQAPPSVVQYLNSLGVHTGDIASYFLNDQNPTPQLQLKLNQAQIGGAALQNNLMISAADSLRFAQQGVTYAQAQSAYQRIADILPTADKLSAIYKSQAPVNQNTLQEEFLGNSGTAQLARERLSQQEEAAFSGQSGVGKSSFQQQTSGAPTF